MNLLGLRGPRPDRLTLSSRFKTDPGRKGADGRNLVTLQGFTLFVLLLLFIFCKVLLMIFCLLRRLMLTGAVATLVIGLVGLLLRTLFRFKEVVWFACNKK